MAPVPNLKKKMIRYNQKHLQCLQWHLHFQTESILQNAVYQSIKITSRKNTLHKWSKNQIIYNFVRLNLVFMMAYETHCFFHLIRMLLGLDFLQEPRHRHSAPTFIRFIKLLYQTQTRIHK